MANVNIPRDVKDEFYRYKMPSLQAKVEGRGNGIKTVIVNMSAIAKSLDRPPAYPTKFFGFELGALTSIEPETDKYIVNGKHDQPKLAEVLDDFIEKFILCKKCQRNPETTMHIRQEALVLKCKACGGRTPVDMTHKLSSYIMKNFEGGSGGSSSKKESKRERKLEKSRSGKSSKKREEGEPDENNQEEGEPDASETPMPRSSSKKSKKREEDEEEGVVWHTDTSKEAAEERRKHMFDGDSEITQKLFHTALAEQGRTNPVDVLNAFLATERSNDEIINQIQAIKTQEKLDNELTAKAVMMTLFDKDVVKQLNTRDAVLKKFLTLVGAQPGTLAGVVELCAVKDKTLLKSVPHVLKALYDKDYLEEEAILKWADAKTQDEESKQVKASAKVFVEWLRNAEEDSDDDEEA